MRPSIAGAIPTPSRPPCHPIGPLGRHTRYYIGLGASWRFEGWDLLAGGKVLKSLDPYLFTTRGMECRIPSETVFIPSIVDALHI
jgi:hypothetical protein